MVWLALSWADLQEVWGFKSPELDGVQLDTKFSVSSSDIWVIKQNIHSNFLRLCSLTFSGEHRRSRDLTKKMIISRTSFDFAPYLPADWNF